MATATSTRSPAELVALVLGAVYLTVGLVGFFVTGFDNFATYDDGKLIIFTLNPMHNVVHLAIGGVLLWAGMGYETAKQFNVIVGGVLILVGLLGLIQLDFVNELISAEGGFGDPDVYLHVISGGALVYFGTAGAGTPGAGTQTPAS